MAFPVANSRKLADTLNLWITVLLAVVAAIALSLSWVFSGIQLRKEIKSRAQTAAMLFAKSLRDPVWNLDNLEIYQIMIKQVLLDDFPFVRVTDQFGGGLYQRGETSPKIDEHNLKSRHRIVYQGELIGWVEVWGNMESLRTVRAEIMGWITVTILLSLGIILLATRKIVEILISRPLGKLAENIGRIAAGEYQLTLLRAHSCEFETINQQILNMAGQISERTGQLEDLRDNLEKLVAKRTAALEGSNRALADQVQRRKEAQQRLLTVSGMERQRIGRDLHDTLGQQLTGINFIISSLANQLEQEGVESAECAQRIAMLVQDAITQNRQISRGLVGTEMSGDSFINEVERLADDTSKLYEVDCTFIQHGELLKIDDPEVGMHLYRIIQEAIHNAMRHGHARSIEIAIITDPDNVLIRIVDDGVGITETESSNGLGMTTMSYRTEMLGGTFEIRNGEAGGTEIRTCLPNPPDLESSIME